MAQQSSQQEPTMEEILASIRRIISEDAEEQPKEPAPAPPVRARAPEPEPMPTPVLAEEEEVLELDQIIEEEPLPVMQAPEPPPPPPRPAAQMRPAPAPRPRAPEPPPAEEEDFMLVDAESDSKGLLSQSASNALASAFGQLHTRQRVSDDPGTTLEDIVRGMLKPLLQDWLEHNLPPLVERLVAEEIERAQRQATRRR